MLPRSRTNNERLTIPNGEIAHLACGAQIYWHKPHAVLITAICGVEQPKQRVASLVWFQISDHGNCLGRELFLFAQSGFEFIDTEPEWKFDPGFRPLGNAHDDFGKHLIEGRSEIVEDFSGSDRQFRGEGARKLKAPNLFIGIGSTSETIV
jgi:hypothetical protein